MRVILLGTETAAGAALEEGLRAAGRDVSLLMATDFSKVEAACQVATPDVLLVEPRLPEPTFLDLLRRLLDRMPGLPVVVLAANPSIDLVVNTMKLGAFDFVAKHDGYGARLVSAVEEALKKRNGEQWTHGGTAAKETRLRDMSGGSSPLAAILGESASILQLKRRAARIMNLDLHVLIRGETGTGKELLARAIHEGSRRHSYPFVPVNCAALAPELVESELFGHEKGAFTGACAKRLGKVMEANHGTLFLDEVGDLPAPMQAKLLRLLQEGEVQRVGVDRPVIVDVRVLAATNQPLELLTGKGMFRSDLYHRLNTISLTIPPLRERGEDILLLARVLIKRFAGELGRTPPELSHLAEAELLSHSWSGNFRELENVIRRELLFCDGETLCSFGLQPSTDGREIADERRPGGGELLDVGEGDQLTWLLRRYRGNLSRVAKHLHISRPTAYKRIQAHGLKLRDFR